MKKQSYLVIFFTVCLSFACSLLGTSPDTQSAASEPSNPPAQIEQTESDDLAASENESNEINQESEFESDDAEPPAAENLAIGPDMLDLSNPALFEYPFSNYIEKLEYRIDGMDTEGNAATFEMEMSNEVQTDPEDASRMNLTSNETGSEEETFETTTIGGQVYFYSIESGCFVYSVEDSEDINTDDFFLNNSLINEATRVETDVIINGVMTDRYELAEANFETNDLGEEFSLDEGDVYLAREGGYLVRIHLLGTTTSSDSFGNLDPNTEATVSYTYDVSPIDGPLNITPPEGCASQSPDELAYPLMDDAYDVTSMVGSVFYQTDYSLDEVLDFYRTEMVDQGWTITEDSVMGSFASLEFTKDGVTVSVLPIQNGDVVAVTIAEE